MNSLSSQLERYLDACRYQKSLDAKSLKAYRIDLTQFLTFAQERDEPLARETLLAYIAHLHQCFQPSTVRRKLASLKAFCSYLEYERCIDRNPFWHIRTKFKEPLLLPKTIPLPFIERLLQTVYDEAARSQAKEPQRDAAVIELLFATGVRISELCSLRQADVDLAEQCVRIFGKGSKERIVQLGNDAVLTALKRYRIAYAKELAASSFFFVNRCGHRLSEQSVRLLLNKYAALAHIPAHLTPHMFRHSFATLLLEADVDVRCIQQLLGHSSIVTTQIYTHVSSHKQKWILTHKHPRSQLAIQTTSSPNTQR